MDVHGSDVGPDWTRPYADGCKAAIFEHRLEDRSVKPLHLFATFSAHSEYVGKVGIPRKNSREGMCIVSIPRMDHCRDDLVSRKRGFGSR
jgi:hypothetical protein